MTTHGDFSPAARDRAQRTVLVADVFADNAERIVAALDDVPEGHVLVAVVDASHELTGMHHVGQTDLVLRVPELEQTGGWAMPFAPGTTVEDIRDRTGRMASLAAQRAAVIDRISARRGDSGD